MKTYNCLSLMLGFMLLTSIAGASQTRQDTTIVPRDDDYESLLEQMESDEEDPGLLEKILTLQDQPLDLNTASRRDLTRIPGLTPGEIQAILHLRRSLKSFPSVEHLALLDDGDLILSKIRPFVFVTQDDRPPALPSVRMTTRTVKDLQPRRGFTDRAFLGSGPKAYNRLLIDYDRRFSAGVLTEKDAGERFGDGFLSGYVMFRDEGFLPRVIVGDYTVDAGQGLVLWRASAFGKGSEAVAAAKKAESGIQPYRSSDEFNFFRGAAATIEIPLGADRMSISGWYSRRSLDASDSDDGITSFYTAGLFRTESELRRRGTVTATTSGGRMRYISGTFSAGATMISSRFSRPVIAERLFRFAGEQATAGGVDVELALGWLGSRVAQVTFIGELAHAGNSYACTFATTFNVTSSTNFAVVYRNYPPGFLSLYANGFGERGDTQNERGLYLACNIRAAAWLRISAFIDHFHFPWRTFENPLPSTGREIFFQGDGRMGKILELSVRVSAKSTETTKAAVDSLMRNTRLQTQREHRRARVTATYMASRHVRLRGRIEHVVVAYPLLAFSEPGWLMFQEVRFSGGRFTIDGRIIFFHTDSYDSRIYEYENDLRGVFANPALFGKGRRWYLLMRWQALDMLILSMKYAETHKDQARSLSSGLMEIAGNIDNRISVQIEVKL